MLQTLKVKSRVAIKAFIQKFGYDIVNFPKLEGPYEKIHVKSFYAPWKEDTEFQNCFAKILLHSMVDKHRCYELWDLVQQSAKLKGALLEIGVWRGGTGCLIAKRARLCGISDPIYLCDTFSGVVKASERDDIYKGGEHGDTSMGIVLDLAKNLHLDNIHILKGIFPEDTGVQVEDLKFRFCHIDVDVYASAVDIVSWVWPRMVVGGIIVFDDYGFPTTNGIRDYVNELKAVEGLISLHNLNGHAVWVKINDSKQSLNVKNPSEAIF